MILSRIRQKTEILNEYCQTLLIMYLDDQQQTVTIENKLKTEREDDYILNYAQNVLELCFLFIE